MVAFSQKHVVAVPGPNIFRVVAKLKNLFIPCPALLTSDDICEWVSDWKSEYTNRVKFLYWMNHGVRTVTECVSEQKSAGIHFVSELRIQSA